MPVGQATVRKNVLPPVPVPAYFELSAHLDASTDAITAHSGGGQASAVALTTPLNRVTVCAADHDSVKLPAAKAGMKVSVINSTAHILDVYATGTETINAIAASSPLSVGAALVTELKCPVDGKWFSFPAVVS